ncbi:hypothetical protein QFZ33_002763 [Arthrobacter globiformis]|nr:hypothetical protein [Arthrobacter globiformis]
MGRLQQRDLPASRLSLSKEDLEVLDGIQGRAAQQAMRIIVRMAHVQQATELVDVSHVHIGGSIYTGKGGLNVIEELVSNGAKVRVPTTLNAISIDRSQTGASNSGNESTRTQVGWQRRSKQWVPTLSFPARPMCSRSHPSSDKTFCGPSPTQSFMPIA